MDMKEKLEKQIKDTGSISSGDMRSINSDPEKDPESKLQEDSTVNLSDKVKNDPLLNVAEQGNPQQELKHEIADAKDSLDRNMKVVVGSSPPKNITLLSTDKSRFLDSLISNGRFVLPFSLFNGRVTGEFRSRTQEESLAVFEQLDHELAEGSLTSQLSYAARLRNMLLAAQVAVFNGEHLVALKEPLNRVRDGDDVTPPGWLNQVDYWQTQSDAVVNSLFQELRIFEYKYLTMIENANDQNFWKTAQSI